MLLMMGKMTGQLQWRRGEVRAIPGASATSRAYRYHVKAYQRDVQTKLQRSQRLRILVSNNAHCERLQIAGVEMKSGRGKTRRRDRFG
jgi:hypothetical protein